jgi:hypothetical protein
MSISSPPSQSLHLQMRQGFTGRRLAALSSSSLVPLDLPILSHCRSVLPYTITAAVARFSPLPLLPAVRRATLQSKSPIHHRLGAALSSLVLLSHSHPTKYSFASLRRCAGAESSSSSAGVGQPGGTRRAGLMRAGPTRNGTAGPGLGRRHSPWAGRHCTVKLWAGLARPINERAAPCQTSELLFLCILTPCSFGLISHQPAVLFSQNKSATSNQPTILFSQNKSAPVISHQPPAKRTGLLFTQVLAYASKVF